MTAPTIRFVGILTSLLLLAQMGTAQTPPDIPRYSITNLGTLGGKYVEVEAMNDRGQIIGMADFPGDTQWAHGYLWQNGKMKELPRFQPLAINAVGKIVGIRTDFTAAFYSHGRISPLSSQAGRPLEEAEEAKAINSQGQGVGSVILFTPSGPKVVAVIWRSGKAQPLSMQPVAVSGQSDAEPKKVSSSEAMAVNRRGEIVGKAGFPQLPTSDPNVPWTDHVVLWRDGKMLDLGVPKGFQETDKPAFNDHGQIVLEADAYRPKSAYKYGSFLWKAGRFTPLNLPPGFRYTDTYAISDSGVIVGDIETASFKKYAAVWKNGLAINLNNLIPAGSGWVLQQAKAINNRGQIAGEGTFHGQDRAFLLTPLMPHSVSARAYTGIHSP